MSNKAPRITYGVGCSWWDSIDKVSTNTAGLPCCPYCKGLLYEVDSEEKWWEGADQYENDGHPNYIAMLNWMRGKCFKDYPTAQSAYKAEHN